jgi:hypothetical protein
MWDLKEIHWDLVLVRHRILAGTSVHKKVIVLTYFQVKGVSKG